MKEFLFGLTFTVVGFIAIVKYTLPVRAFGFVCAVGGAIMLFRSEADAWASVILIALAAVFALFGFARPGINEENDDEPDAEYADANEDEKCGF